MNLKELQDGFLKSVLSDSFDEDVKASMIPGGKLDKLGCLGAYRNDYTARLTSTLGDNFESIWTILGDKEFFEVCAAYIKENPSTLYDLGEYGNSLPQFLKTHELKYLSELANLEIEFRRLFNCAPKESVKQELFATLGNPSDLIFKLTPHTHYSSSEFPIYRICENRGNNSEESFNKIDWVPERFLMYNSTGSVQVIFLSEFQYELLNKLSLGSSLSEAIESCEAGTEAEVSELFSNLVTSQLIIGIER